jgi:thiol-disulfide isomerase/thioredoxin
MRMSRILLFVLLMLLTRHSYSQSQIYRAQQELIGSKVWKLDFTHWLENKPADTVFNGRLKVLEFWATWCRPCLRAIPHMNELQREFQDSAIVFLSVTHQSPEDTKATLAKYNFETIVVADTTERVHQLLRIAYNGVMGLPRTVIVDAENNIRWYGNPQSLSPKLIRRMLKEFGSKQYKSPGSVPRANPQ